MRKFKVVRHCLVTYHCTDVNAYIDLRIGQIWDVYGIGGEVLDLIRDNVHIELDKDTFNKHFREVVKK